MEDIFYQKIADIIGQRVVNPVEAKDLRLLYEKHLELIAQSNEGDDLPPPLPLAMQLFPDREIDYTFSLVARLIALYNTVIPHDVDMDDSVTYYFDPAVLDACAVCDISSFGAVLSPAEFQFTMLAAQKYNSAQQSREHAAD